MNIQNLTAALKVVAALDAEGIQILTAAIDQKIFSGPLAAVEPFAEEALAVLRFLAKIEAILKGFGIGA